MASGLKLRNALFWMAPRIVVESRRYGNDVRTLENVEVGASFVADIGTVFKPRYYLVTAGHVVEHAEAGAILFLRSWGDKIAAGEPRLHEYRRHRFAELWYYARDPKLDIAITPLSYGELGEATDHISIGVVPLTQGYNKYLKASERASQLRRGAVRRVP